MSDPYFEAGKEAYDNTGTWFAHLRHVPGDVAIKYFMPPVKESNIQMAQPLPPERVEWIKGWDTQKEIENESKTKIRNDQSGQSPAGEPV